MDKIKECFGTSLNYCSERRSTTAWVVHISDNDDGTTIGCVESITRVIYTLEGRRGYWIRYDNHYYPLHTIDEFKQLKKRARSKEIYFFNNSGNQLDGRKILKNTSDRAFIIKSEIGPWCGT